MEAMRGVLVCRKADENAAAAASPFLGSMADLKAVGVCNREAAGVVVLQTPKACQNDTEFWRGVVIKDPSTISVDRTRRTKTTVFSCLPRLAFAVSI